MVFLEVADVSEKRPYLRAIPRQNGEWRMQNDGMWVRIGLGRGHVDTQEAAGRRKAEG